MNDCSVLRSLAATCVLVTVAALSIVSPALAQRAAVKNPSTTSAVTKTADGFTIATRAVELTISQGAITRIHNKLTGEIHTSPSGSSAWMPRGLVCSAPESGGMRPVQELHQQWGAHPIYGVQLAETLARITRGPTNSSAVEWTPIPRGMRCTWRGLSNGAAIFPGDSVTIEATADPKTDLIEITASGITSTSADVVGLMVPVVNLHSQHSLSLPSFGGLRFAPSDLYGRKLFSLEGAPFIEAPIIAAETPLGVFGMWIEDQTFRPYATFYGGDGMTTAFAIEAVNEMPFEGKRATRTASWKLGAFRGTWTNAMTPYRTWYLRTFGTEIAMRRQPAWAQNISVIVDRVGPAGPSLTRLAAELDPSRVLIHDWYARQPEFDTMLPDWTPRSSFRELVGEAHRHGFKAMGYVNTYCVNYGSPVFERDNIRSIGLTRRHTSIARYGDPVKTFANSAAGELLYLDPISPAWRRYHTDQMIRWRVDSGADANYEDTGGTAGDFGNGAIGGISGAQGGSAQFYDLLQRNPVPMATEYAPDNMAFASTWALRYSQSWGTDDIRKQWESRHRPIATYLFGGAARAWVPTNTAETEAGKWTVLACSDALGGVAQLEATAVSFDSTAGLARHMMDRAKLFATLGLVPHFDGWPKDPNVLCQYRDRAGSLYHYRLRDGVQELAKVGGATLYQRVSGKTRLDSTLRIPGWPAFNATGPIGLNPTAMYALAPAPPDSTLVRIDRLPTASAITRYVEDGGFVLVNFDRNGQPFTDSTASLVARTAFTDVILRSNNGRVMHRGGPLASGARLDLRLAEACELLLVRSPLAAPEITARGTDGILLSMNPPKGSFVMNTSGFERGGEFTPPHTVNWSLGGTGIRLPFRFTAGGGDSEIALDHLTLVPSSTSTVEFTVRNTQSKYGNGCICRVLVNGRQVASKDLGPQRDAWGNVTWSTTGHRFRVPLGGHAGLPVVVTIAVWGKGDANADEIWMSDAKFIDDVTQSASTATVGVTE